MTETSEVRLLAAETAISLEAALATAEQIAQHGIFERNSFEILMTLLEDSASAVDQIRRIVDGEAGYVVGHSPTAPTCDRGQTALQVISGTSRFVRPTHAGPPPLRLVSSQDG